MYGKYKTSIWIIAILLNITCLTDSLRITNVKAPGPLVTGEGGLLECDWDLQNDGLYAVKWYLGLNEFYRWTPAENPTVRTFPIPGNPIVVDLASSQEGKVYIHHVTLEAGGIYRCEVSAEAPSFHTESKVAIMHVVDLPDSKPRITGAQISYQMHENVMLNCSSPHSQPPAKLTFYVNTELADPSWLVSHPSIKDRSSGLETSILGLDFPLWPRLLRHGNVNVKCTAEIGNLYYDSTEVLIAGDIPYHASIMEDRGGGGGGAGHRDVYSRASAASSVFSEGLIGSLPVNILVVLFLILK